MADLPQMLTVTDVAKLLRRSPRHVREELIGKGRLRAIRLTRKGNWLIPSDAVERLLGRKLVIPNEPSDATLLRDRVARQQIRALYLKSSQRPA